MNDIEKAIEFYKAKDYEEGGLRDKYTKLAIEALEKQIPKKALNQTFNMVGFCPSCKIIVENGMEKFNYCPDCGQKLDWGR